MRKATRAQWIKFGIITLLYLIFLVWVKSGDWLSFLLYLTFISVKRYLGDFGRNPRIRQYAVS